MVAVARSIFPTAVYAHGVIENPLLRQWLLCFGCRAFDAWSPR